jgi:hypothetical protein
MLWLEYHFPSGARIRGRCVLFALFLVGQGSVDAMMYAFAASGVA